MSKKLSDKEVYDRLHAADLALGTEDGDTDLGNNTLKAARTSIKMLQFGVVKAEEEGLSKNPAIKAQDEL